MKKTGFTLAEILIVLGIVGIIAALSIPTLVSEHQKRIYATSLSAAISNLENAASAVIMKSGVNYLDELADGEFIDRLRESLVLEDDTINIDGTEYLTGKNNIAYNISVSPEERQDEDNTIAQGGNLVAKYADVIIDVNGEAKPNTDGRDRFYLVLGHDGKLYPEGGKDWAVYTGGAENFTSTSVGSRNAAAYLMYNGYNMDY